MTASSLYLKQFIKTDPSRLTTSSNIIAPASIDPSAQIDPSAKIGPNVAIGPGVRVGKGVRVKDAIIMEGSTLEEHSCVLNSIVGTDCSIGKCARVDGEPEPEQEVKGQISVTVLGQSIGHKKYAYPTDDQLPKSPLRAKCSSEAASSCPT